MHGLAVSQCVLLFGLIPLLYLKYTIGVFQNELFIIMVLLGNHYCLSSIDAFNLLRIDIYLDELSSV